MPVPKQATSAGHPPDRREDPESPSTPGVSSTWSAAWAWTRERLAVVGHGVLLFGLALAGLGLLLALFAALGLAVALSVKSASAGHQRLTVTVNVLGFLVWLALCPLFLLCMRSLARLTRRLVGQWCDVPIADPYLPPPWADGGKAGLRRRLRWLLTDQATWRDLLWVTVDGCVGWVLPILPAGLLVLGFVGLVAPYSRPELRVLTVAAAAFGLWVSPWLMRGYGVWARSMLAPTRRAELALRVRELAETRTEALDTSAAEIRRIERDLHDGAQARLVAMGMTLDAAGQLVDTNPEAARALLFEARDASVKALAELRALVRGIHPPVLADRGLADAIQALALDSPMRISLASDLRGRPPAPIESAAYFAVSELLANVSKHAEARQTWIDLRYTDGMLRIGVTDSGHGGADPVRGSGLRGIERRLAPFDGVLAVISPPGGPTAVTMEIPCELSSLKTSSS